MSLVRALLASLSLSSFMPLAFTQQGSDCKMFISRKLSKHNSPTSDNVLISGWSTFGNFGQKNRNSFCTVAASDRWKKQWHVLFKEFLIFSLKVPGRESLKTLSTLHPSSLLFLIPLSVNLSSICTLQYLLIHCYPFSPISYLLIGH